MNLEEVKKLRKETNLPIMECKKALEEAEGDYNKAKEILKEKGIETLNKKAQRSTSAGIIVSYTHANRIGVLLELACETDFVAKNEEFKKLALEILLQIASMAPKSKEELLNQIYIRDESKTVKDLLTEKIAQLGENIKVKRFLRWELGEENGG